MFETTKGKYLRNTNTIMPIKTLEHKQMKHILLISLLLIGFHSIGQQSFKWGTCLGGKSEDVINDIVCAGNSIYAAGKFSISIEAGKKEASAYGAEDIFLSKLDKNGNVVWIKSLGGNYNDNANCLAVTGNKILMSGTVDGKVHFEKQDYSGDGHSLFVAAWTPSGKIDWLKRLDFSGSATMDVMEVAADGTILAGGMLKGSLKVNDKTINSGSGKRGFLISLTPEGDVIDAELTKGKGIHRLKAISFGESNTKYLLFQVDGLFEFLENSKDVFTTDEDFKGLILLKEQENEIKWAKYIEGNSYIDAVGLSTGNSNCITACINYSGELSFEDKTIRTSALQGVALINFNELGEYQWYQELISPTLCYSMDAIQTRTGNMLLAGYFRSSYALKTGEIIKENLDKTENMFLAYFDQEGNLIWNDEPGNDAFAFGRAVTLNSDGDIILAGGFDETLDLNGVIMQSKGKNDALIAKYFNCDQLEISIAGEAPICEGGFVELGVKGSGFDSYVWNDEVWTEDIIVELPGTYFVEAFDGKGCSAKDTVVIELAQVPQLGLEDKIELFEGETKELTANAGFLSYIWDDGSVGASRTITYLENTDSLVCVVNAESVDGCTKSDSTIVYFLHEEIEKITKKSFFSHNVWPNPVEENLSWKIEGNGKANVIVKITDPKGVLVYTSETINYPFWSTQNINVEFLASGNYLLTLILGDITLIEKFIKK